MLSAIMGLLGWVAGVGLVCWGAVIRAAMRGGAMARSGAAMPGGAALDAG